MSRPPRIPDLLKGRPFSREQALAAGLTSRQLQGRHLRRLFPPLDDVGVRPAAAFIGYAASARMIDLIKVGDWLLHREHMSLIEVAELARRDLWRPGAQQVLRVLPHLDGRARSVKESETRALLIFAGLPVPEVNVDLGSWEYVQITQELLRRPRALVLRVHRKLVERGYAGPAPVFGATWRSLFEPVRLRKTQAAVGQQRQN